MSRLLFIARLAVGVLGALASASFLLWVGWDTFIVHVLGWPSISFVDACGLALLVGLVYAGIYFLKEERT